MSSLKHRFIWIRTRQIRHRTNRRYSRVTRGIIQIPAPRNATSYPGPNQQPPDLKTRKGSPRSFHQTKQVRVISDVGCTCQGTILRLPRLAKIYCQGRESPVEWFAKDHNASSSKLLRNDPKYGVWRWWQNLRVVFPSFPRFQARPFMNLLACHIWQD